MKKIFLPDGKHYIEIHKDIELVYVFDKETNELKGAMELKDLRK